MQTHRGCSLRNSLTQSTRLLLTFRSHKPFKTRWDRTVLKAEEKSIKKIGIWVSALSKRQWTLFKRVSGASSTPRLDRYANNMGSKNSTVWRESSLHTRGSIHLLRRGVRVMGLTSLRDLACDVFGTGIIVDVFQTWGTQLVLRDIWNSQVKIGVSWTAQSFRTFPSNPYGPGITQGLTLKHRDDLPLL